MRKRPPTQAVLDNLAYIFACGEPRRLLSPDTRMASEAFTKEGARGLSLTAAGLELVAGHPLVVRARELKSAGWILSPSQDGQNAVTAARVFRLDGRTGEEVPR
jgi:hypothetical protein